MHAHGRFNFAGSAAGFLLFCLSLISPARALAQATPSGAAVISQVDVSDRQGAATVQVSGAGQLTPHTERLIGPDRLVLDFENARLGAIHLKATPVGPVRAVRVGQFKPDVARVVVDLASPAPFQIESSGGSVTIVFQPGGANSAQPPAASQRSAAQPEPQPPAAANKPALLATKATPARAMLTPAVASSRASSTPPAPPAAAAPAAMEVTATAPNSFENGLLTFTAKDRPLGLVLDDIGSITNIPIVLSGGVGDEHVSVEFRSYRLDEALRQVLKNYDFIFSYSGNDAGDGNLALHTVWVYPANQGPGMSRFAMAAWNTSARQYVQATSDADPDARSHAVDELIRRDGRGAVSTVMEALKDPSDKVRYQALYRAVLVGALPPEDTMIDLALNDPSEQVKVWAFQTLPLDPTLRWVALRLSSDANQQLAGLARNYLSDLDASLGATGATAGAITPQGEPDNAPPQPKAVSAPVFPTVTSDTPSTLARRPIPSPGP